MLKLHDPDRRHPTYRVRGKYLGVKVDRSTGATSRAVAQTKLVQWRTEIERGCYIRPEEPTWASAVISYVQAGGEERFLTRLTEYFGTKVLREIRQEDVDTAAATLYPDCKPTSRNRQVYGPVSAVMKHAGVPWVRTADGIGQKRLTRPKGAWDRSRVVWLRPEQADALISAAWRRAALLEQTARTAPNGLSRYNAGLLAKSARRFAVLISFLLYTGTRLGEALKITAKDIELERSIVHCGKTKNGDDRPVHLPPWLIDELRAMEWGSKTVFSLGKGGQLYKWFQEIRDDAGVDIPRGTAYHVFRHTYATWMRRYGGLDTSGLVATGAWRSHTCARIYEHLETSEEAQKADLLPVLSGRQLGIVRQAG